MAAAEPMIIAQEAVEAVAINPDLALLGQVVACEGSVFTAEELPHSSASSLVITHDPKTGRLMGLFGVANEEYISKGKKKHQFPTLVTIGGNAKPGETLLETGLREAGEETPALTKFWAMIYAEARRDNTHVIMNNDTLSWFHHNRAKKGAKKPFYAALITFHVAPSAELATLKQLTQEWFASLSDEEKTKEEVSHVEWVPLDAIFQSAQLADGDVRELAGFATLWSRDEQAARAAPHGFDDIVKSAGSLAVRIGGGETINMATFVARSLMLGWHQIQVVHQQFLH
jgi:hypothetical protein